MAGFGKIVSVVGIQIALVFAAVEVVGFRHWGADRQHIFDMRCSFILISALTVRIRCKGKASTIIRLTLIRLVWQLGSMKTFRVNALVVCVSHKVSIVRDAVLGSLFFIATELLKQV
jgi:hypothetical protein